MSKEALLAAMKSERSRPALEWMERHVMELFELTEISSVRIEFDFPGGVLEAKAFRMGEDGPPAPPRCD